MQRPLTPSKTDERSQKQLTKLLPRWVLRSTCKYARPTCGMWWKKCETRYGKHCRMAATAAKPEEIGREMHEQWKGW
eukprot:1220686-Amphidinium_carterae.1